MANLNSAQPEGPITFPLTIRTTNKSMDEMVFKCPLAWTVSQLKLFIGMNHKNGNDYLRSDKLKLIYQARILPDDETLSDVLKNKDIRRGVLILAYTQPKQAPNQTKEHKISPVMNELLFKDYARQLTKYVTQPNRELNTNIKGLDLLSILPMRAEKFTGSVLKLGTSPSAKAADFLNNGANGSQQQAQQQQNNQLGGNVGDNEGFLGLDEPREGEALDFNFHFKMIIKLAIFLFIFVPYFQGFSLILIILVVVIYYWMKMKAIKVGRRRLINHGAQNNNNPAQQNNANPEATGAQGQQALNIQQNNNKQLKGWNLTLAKAKELCVCFVFSMFPAWNIDIYLEERRSENLVEDSSNDVQNNAQPSNNVPHLAANSNQTNANEQLQNRGEAQIKLDNSINNQYSQEEEEKEQNEHNRKDESTKEVELQRFESNDGINKDPLLD